MSPTSSTEILNEILYNRNIRFAVYGGLYLFLFLFVATVSFIKTYQNEKANLHKNKRAFQSSKLQSQAAPVQLTDTELRIIQERKAKKNNTKKAVEVTLTVTVESQTQTTQTTLDYSQNTHTNIEPMPPMALSPSESTVHSIQTNASNVTNPIPIPLRVVSKYDKVTEMSPSTVKIDICSIDDDEDDYYGHYSVLRKQKSTSIAHDPNSDETPKHKKKNECFCADFCYIICLYDFWRHWPKDTWQLRSVYSVIIVYLSDSFTDLNILMVWSIQAWNQYRAQQTYSSENGLNMVIMAIASCAVLVFSKIITAFAVWKATGNPWFGVLQFCDLYIFVEAYESHKVGHKTDRLRWLSNLESVFEASPQVILQLVFLMHSTADNSDSFIVWVGLFFSVLKLGNTAINNDSVHVSSAANRVSNYKFWLRSFFRIAEITAREFMYVLMWLVIGEKFLLMVLILNCVHNCVLYYGGCLSRQSVNIFAHTIALAQLSYTICEGKPLSFFKRGRLHSHDRDDTRSKLQFPYSIFIQRYNNAKRQQKQRRAAERKMRARIYNNSTFVSSSSALSVANDASFMSKTTDGNESGYDLEPSSMMSGSDSAIQNITKKDRVSEKSVSDTIMKKKKGKPPRSAGALQLNAIANGNDLLMNEKIKLTEIEKYKTSEGSMDGLYSYVSWVHHAMVAYLNIYLSSQRPQQIMMSQRTVLSLFWLLIIGIHGNIDSLNQSKSEYWHSAYHKRVSFSAVPILAMYCTSIAFTLLAMTFFALMMENEVINEVKKKEEIQFKTVYDAIYYGRLDAIINQFDKTLHLCGHSSEGKSPLYYACELLQIDIAAWLIHKKCTDINACATQNRTPLYIACRVGCFEIVKMLLAEHGCKYNEANSLGRTPLYAACREGHTQIVCELLSQPLIDINRLTLHRSCALAAASQHGYADIVVELLKKPEIEINVVNESNYTPIFIAALGTHSHIVQILLQRPEIEIDKGVKNDETLFYVSCERGMHGIVRILIDRADYAVDINRANSRAYTPLYIAACFGHAQIIEILMGIDQTTLNTCDNIGRTPFFVACRKGNDSAVFALLEYDNIDIHKRDQDELTPFAAACQGGSVAIVERLMKLVDRSEIIGVDRMQRTPFFMACREGCTAVVLRLMREANIIDINQCDKLARTPLMVCVKRGHSQCVASLCATDAIDINQCDHQDRSPLFIAAKCGPSHIDCISHLMERSDLLINAKALGGKTALHIACELGHSSIVMLLLDHTDIDVNEPDDYGTSPLAITDKKLDNTVYMRMVMISMRDPVSDIETGMVDEDLSED